jgi:hypothetical protein
MDIWRILMSILQVIAANQMEFERVERPPWRVSTALDRSSQTLYGNIIVMFDVAVLRGQIKDLQ